ncbi:MAG: twin-arginine translocase subunit TatC [Candidatus Hatepunaea meridiana]|nr:twin-arginine translocase subunit TatC [Candidatus Hatepunaea meridiana]
MIPEQLPQGTSDKETDSEPSSSLIMNFLSHLEELRIRLVRAVLFLAIGTGICLIFSKYLLEFITQTFPTDDAAHLALLQPTEGFVVRLKVAFVAGLFLSSPVWFSQLWGFISPALYKNEKKIIIPVVILSVFAFILGAAFGYWILPYATEYFRSFALDDMTVNWSLGKYLDFSLRLLVAFGVVFELPLIVYLMARLGIVSTKQLRKYRRYVFIGILIASGFITPPDIFTQVVLTIPLIVLYELGIIMASIAIRKREKTE